MRRPLFGLLALCAGTLVVSGAAAGAADTPCTGSLGPVTIEVTVVAGPGCDLSGTTVHGNVKVLPGGSLLIFRDAPATISGNVVSKHATTIQIHSGAIGGKVKIDGTGPDGTSFEDSTVGRNLEIRHSASPVRVYNETVGGSLKVSDNSGSSPDGRTGNIRVDYRTVGGDVEVKDNSLTGSTENVLNVSKNGPPDPGSIGGDLHVSHNEVAGGSDVAVLDVQGNGVGRNLHVDHNLVAGGAGAALELGVASNVVGDNMDLRDNTVAGSSYLVFFWGGNTVAKTLDCKKNTPAPTGLPFLGPNSAAKKKGECAVL